MDIDNDLAVFSVWEAKDGEEHVSKLLLNEAVKGEEINLNLATDSRVPGRIKGHHDIYEEIGADPYIINLVKNGYRLEFDREPPPSFTKNNKSALNKKDFVLQELLRLEKLGCIQRVESQPKVVLPLSAVFSKKWRLVVDASRTLNPYCTRRKIMLEDLSHVPLVIREGDFMVVNDLDSGYWHIPIAEEHWTYLGVHFEKDDGSVLFWVWKVLCLGLRDAAFIFTKTLSPLMAELRRRGARGTIYIDDNWTAGKTYEECLYWESQTKELFSKAGWVFKPGKRSGNPAQVCRFLGLDLDSRDLTFNIPEDKLQKIESKATELLKRKFNKVQSIASFVGLLQSVRLATGPIVSILTRSLYHLINCARNWCSFVRFDDLAKFEVSWWQQNIRSVCKFPMSRDLSAIPASCKIASDGSGVGYFCYELGGNTCLARRPFSEQESGESSTYRELLAFHDTWTNVENLKKFRGMRVAHHTDSQALVHIIAKGSRNRKLQPLVMRAFLNLREYGIIVEPVWLSRDDGVIRYADMGSRDFHSDDISVDAVTFAHAVKVFGPFTVDGFASASNAKCRKFYSKLDVPGSAGVNFFMQKLRSDDNHWIFPPIGRLCQAVMHLMFWKACGVVVIPVWPRSSFFPFFFPDGKHLAMWVVDVLWTRPFFVCGPLVESSCLRGYKSFDTVMVKADFRDFDMALFYTPRLDAKWCREGGCFGCDEKGEN